MSFPEVASSSGKVSLLAAVVVQKLQLLSIYLISFPFLHTISCSHVPGTMDIRPTSHLVFSAHKLPAYHCTTQAFSGMHPYLLCSLCTHLLYMHSSLSTHISTTPAFLLQTQHLHFMYRSAMYSQCKCSPVVHIYVHYILVDYIHTFSVCVHPLWTCAHPQYI